MWKTEASSVELCRVRACCQCISRRAGLSGGRTRWWQRNLASNRCGWQALGEEEPLRPTHRLDACTAGLVVLGRTAAFVAGFNKLLAAAGPPRAVQKIYRALSAAPPPLGALLCTLQCLYPLLSNLTTHLYHPCVICQSGSSAASGCRNMRTLTQLMCGRHTRALGGGQDTAARVAGAHGRARGRGAGAPALRAGGFALRARALGRRRGGGRLAGD